MSVVGMGAAIPVVSEAGVHFWDYCLMSILHAEPCKKILNLNFILANLERSHLVT